MSSAFDTTSEARRHWVATLGLIALAVVGTGRLTVRADGGFALPPDDPIAQARRALIEATGGDDVVVVVLRDDRGILSRKGIEVIEAAAQALSQQPTLRSPRALTRAPLLTVTEEGVGAETPLWPLPETPGGLAAARARVLADPFVVGSLLSPDGTIALLPAWIRRGSEDAALAARASAGLADPALRATPEGAALQRLVDEARLHVLLGAGGPPEPAVARALRAQHAASPGGATAARWVEEAKLAAADPEAAALSEATSVVAGLRLPEGTTAAVLGAPALRAALAERFSTGVGLLLLAALLGTGAAAARSSWAPVAAAALSAAAVAGAMGLSGLQLDGLSAFAPVVGALVAAACALSGLPLAALFAAVLPLLCLGIALSWTSDGGVATALAALIGPVAGAALRRAARPVPAPSPAPIPVWRRGVVAVGLLVAAAVAIGLPLGQDPARLLSRRHPVGEMTWVVDARVGMASPAHLVLAGAAAGAMADPATIASLRAAQRTLEDRPEVLGTLSWADFVAALHSAIANTHAGALPQEAALVEQYLLLFGRPEETRPLVAPDLSLASGLVRLRPGSGALLAELAEERGAGPVRVAGGAVEVAVVAARLARRGALGLLLGVCCAILALGGTRGRTCRRDGFAPLAASMWALAAGGSYAGSVSAPVLLAGGAVWAVTTAVPPARAALLLLPAALGVLSWASAPASVAVALAVGGAASLLFGGRPDR